MKYHIALSSKTDLNAINQNAQAGKCPSHVVWQMSQILGAKVYQPGIQPILPVDKMRAKIIGSPEHWALARQLSSQLKEDDVVYCTGEDVGIAIATLCGAKRHRPKVVAFTQNINRPRGYLALKLFNIANKIDLFVTASQAEFLRRYLHLPENHVYEFYLQPTDISFFTPGAASEKLRPIIGSGGLERRDYQTLADATKDLNIDVKICAVSPNAPARRSTFPKVMPSNMSCRFYDWCELVQLYRDSDIVVLSLLENKYQAGLTTMFEAMACKRPVIITRSPGIISDLIDAGIVTGVNPSDSVGLRDAIEKLLNDPQKAQEQAQRGYELTLNQYNHSKYVQALVTKLISTFGSVNN
ncbi:glycosyltransferase family 4 protein [Iningainema sp. BLCCT55]|uniref:Glycosyltransferase family 4 protein n=1 Tax=Iningainema tapete BLCC-T55 TaxID=2748662 RepID=A0A8J6XTV6_9CYAN|nr:glycosyltransferase family 4 protein [Iningainema tapete BLCC-T55]